MAINGTILGYDPGGNKAHGVAAFLYEQGQLLTSEIRTFATANQVIDFALSQEKLVAIGVDTLTCWATGHSGWRPADLCLRKNFPSILNSIASANSLYGSMGLNGMSVMIELRVKYPELVISETHPKVLYHALTGKKYDYNKGGAASMDRFLSELFKREVPTENDHEWDAVISVFAVLQGLEGLWTSDLHQLPLASDQRLVKPCGETYYWWPSDTINGPQ